MGFFPDDPEPPPAPARPAVERMPWLRPPADEFPERLLVRELAVRTDRIVIALSHLDVYREGALFGVETVVRGRSEDEVLWARFGGPRANQPRMGLQLGGGSAVVLDRPPRPATMRPHGWSLHQTGGSGGGDGDEYRSAFGLWLWPLPPGGSLEFVLDWPEHGIPETRIELDGDVILAAVPRVQPLWP